jgi:hypothetical protein
MIIFQGGDEQDFVSYFTIYHFIFGIIAGYLGLPLVYWFLIHLCFEIGENVLVRIPQSGSLIRKIEYTYMFYLNSITKHLGFKVETPIYKGDSLANSIGDTVFSITGWIIGYGMFNKKLRYI